MATRIEWCDETWNPVVGCSPVSEGCANCYAARLAATRLKHHKDYRGLAIPRNEGDLRPGGFTGETRFLEHRLEQPLRWKKPRGIFVSDMGDLFHESVPDEWIDRVLAVCALCPRHTFMLLTKRPARMLDYFAVMNSLGCGTSDGIHRLAAHMDVTPTSIRQRWPLPNVWLGVTVENQKRADERLKYLLHLAALGWLTFVSYEPALGPVDFGLDACAPQGDCEFFDCDPKICKNNARINWLIAGGETGPGARPAHPDYFRKVRDDCAAAGVPFFFKGWGAWNPASAAQVTVAQARNAVKRSTVVTRSVIRQGDETVYRVGKKRAGRLLDGKAHEEFPEVKR